MRAELAFKALHAELKLVSHVDVRLHRLVHARPIFRRELQLSGVRLLDLFFGTLEVLLLRLEILLERISCVLKA